MRLPASGSWWSEQILDTVPNERFCARDLKESKSDRTHPAAFLCVKRSLQSRVIGQICVCFDAKGKSCTKGKYENVLSSFSLIGSPTGFQSDCLNHLIV